MGMNASFSLLYSSILEYKICSCYLTLQRKGTLCSTFLLSCRVTVHNLGGGFAQFSPNDALNTPLQNRVLSFIAPSGLRAVPSPHLHYVEDLQQVQHPRITSREVNVGQCRG